MKPVNSKNSKEPKDPVQVGRFLVVRPGVDRRRLMFKGTRVSVHTVLTWLAKGKNLKEILARWSSLKREALAEAIRLASSALVEQSGARPMATDLSVDAIMERQRLWDLLKPKMKPVMTGQYLIVHPGVCFGKLTFEGTRVPVETVMYFLSTGETIEQILESWPYLKREAILEAIQLAAAALVERHAIQAEAAREPTHSGRTA